METSGSEIGSATAPLAATPDEWLPSVGIHTARGLGSDELVPFDLNGLALTRVNFVFHPGITATADGSVVAEHFDWIVETHARAGVSIVPVVIGVANWTDPATGEIKGGAHFIVDEQMGLWRRFCETLALRYGPAGTFWTERPDIPQQPIRAWEVWNEPNLQVFWDPSPAQTPPSPRRFRRIVRAAHEGLRAGDPRARIVLAGLAFPGQGGAENTPWKPFLRTFLDGDTAAARERNRCLFDAISLHPYSESVRGSVELVERVHRFLKNEGLTGRDRNRDVQLWITEVGWAVPVEGLWPACRKMEGGVCTRWSSPLTVERETQQAHRVGALMEQLERRRAHLRLGPTFFYNFEDLQGGECDTAPKWWCFAGAWTRPDRGRRPRPMWQAVGDAAQQDAQIRVVRLPPVRCAGLDAGGLASDDAADAASEGGV